jgi:hypothetical protein
MQQRPVNIEQHQSDHGAEAKRPGADWQSRTDGNQHCQVGIADRRDRFGWPCGNPAPGIWIEMEIACAVASVSKNRTGKNRDPSAVRAGSASNIPFDLRLTFLFATFTNRNEQFACALSGWRSRLFLELE